MRTRIEQIPPERLDHYSRVPIRLTVLSRYRLDLPEGGLGGMLLVEEPVERPYLKDYDSYGETPTDWPLKFDVTKWAFFIAWLGERPVGAATVARGAAGVFMLEDRPDLAVLWDIRVHPDSRGIGIPLFRQAADWARRHGCSQLMIETQNVNVPACRFYRRMGAELGEIRRFGYRAIPEVAGEVMLNWYLDLET